MLDKVGIRAAFDAGALWACLCWVPGTSLALSAFPGRAYSWRDSGAMAAAYAAFANKGVYNDPHFIRRIVDSGRGDIFLQPNSRRVSERAAG